MGAHNGTFSGPGARDENETVSVPLRGGPQWYLLEAGGKGRKRDCQVSFSEGAHNGTFSGPGAHGSPINDKNNYVDDKKCPRRRALGRTLSLTDVRTLSLLQCPPEGRHFGLEWV